MLLVVVCVQFTRVTEDGYEYVGLLSTFIKPFPQTSLVKTSDITMTDSLQGKTIQDSLVFPCKLYFFPKVHSKAAASSKICSTHFYNKARICFIHLIKKILYKLYKSYIKHIVSNNDHNNDPLFTLPCWFLHLLLHYALTMSFSCYHDDFVFCYYS